MVNVNILFLWLAGFAACLVGCSPIGWEWSYERGMRRAQREQRRALVQFHSPTDEACRTMAKEVFADPEVVKLMQRYVPIRVDAGVHQELAERYGVEFLPAFFVVRPDITIAASHEGAMTTDEFTIFLISKMYE